MLDHFSPTFISPTRNTNVIVLFCKADHHHHQQQGIWSCVEIVVLSKLFSIGRSLILTGIWVTQDYWVIIQCHLSGQINKRKILFRGKIFLIVLRDLIILMEWCQALILILNYDLCVPICYGSSCHKLPRIPQKYEIPYNEHTYDKVDINQEEEG